MFLARRLAQPSRIYRPTCLIVCQRWQSGQGAKEEVEKAKEWARNLQRDWDAPVISYQELKPKTSSPDLDTFLIDVREPGEVVQGMIPSALNIPLSGLGSALHLSPQEFQNTYGFKKPGQDQQVIFYCRSGKRSSSACDVAKRNGFTKILNYKGSWLDWVEQEKKV